MPADASRTWQPRRQSQAGPPPTGGGDGDASGDNPAQGHEEHMGVDTAAAQDTAVQEETPDDPWLEYYRNRAHEPKAEGGEHDTSWERTDWSEDGRWGKETAWSQDDWSESTGWGQQPASAAVDALAARRAQEPRWRPAFGWAGPWLQRAPSFDGEGNENDVGKSARPYVRKIQAWLRCTKLPQDQRALALYSALTGRAWVYAKELNVDLLASPTGIDYYLEWLQTRFMEVEITKISQMMAELFKAGAPAPGPERSGL